METDGNGTSEASATGGDRCWKRPADILKYQKNLDRVWYLNEHSFIIAGIDAAVCGVGV